MYFRVDVNKVNMNLKQYYGNKSQKSIFCKVLNRKRWIINYLKINNFIVLELFDLLYLKPYLKV